MKDTVKKPDIDYVFVTPEMAQKLLDSMGLNRKLRETHAETIARDMTRGKFVGSTSMLRCFGKGAKATMFDGQHRCRAIVLSGIGQWMLIQWNCPPEARDVVDQHAASRRLADVYALRGVPHSALHAAVARRILQYNPKSPESAGFKNMAPLAEEVDELVAHHEKLFNIAIELTSTVPISYIGKRKWATPAMVGQLVFMFGWATNAEHAQEFMRGVAEPEELSAKDPRVVLGKRMQELRSKQARKRYQRETAALFIKAWNYWIHGKSIKHLTFQLDDDVPPIKGWSKEWADLHGNDPDYIVKRRKVIEDDSE